MGFGHRVYKNYDPRAKIIKKACDEVLAKLHITDPLLDIAKNLEEAALNDSYFVERKLYPNVDFYSGIIMRAHRDSGGDVHRDFRHRPHAGLDCQLQGSDGRARPAFIVRARFTSGPTLNHYIADQGPEIDLATSFSRRTRHIVTCNAITQLFLMNIHEYQAKQLLAQYGVAVPAGRRLRHAGSRRRPSPRNFSPKAPRWSSSNRRSTPAAAARALSRAVSRAASNSARPPTTFSRRPRPCSARCWSPSRPAPEGRLVSKLLVAGAPAIKKEFYLAVLLDRATSRPVIMASTEGGMDIEEVADENAGENRQGIH